MNRIGYDRCRKQEINWAFKNTIVQQIEKNQIFKAR